MDRGYRSKSGSIDQSHPGTRRVYTVRLYVALHHLSFELLEIEPGRRRLTAQDRVTLAMDNLLFRVLAVDLVVDLVVVLRQQSDADLYLVCDGDRLRPDNIAQLQNRGFRARRQ